MGDLANFRLVLVVREFTQTSTRVPSQECTEKSFKMNLGAKSSAFLDNLSWQC